MGERFTGGLTGRLPFNMSLKDDAHRLKMARFWRVPEQNLINAMNSKNPGYAVGMMERALKGDVKAFFFVYATHIDLPDQYNLVRPATSKTLQRGAGDLPPRAQQSLCGRDFPGRDMGRGLGRIHQLRTAYQHLPEGRRAAARGRTPLSISRPDLTREPWAAGVHPRLSGATPGTAALRIAALRIAALRIKAQFRVHALVKNAHELLQTRHQTDVHSEVLLTRPFSLRERGKRVARGLAQRRPRLTRSRVKGARI